jgi:hypothetical protein
MSSPTSNGQVYGHGDAVQWGDVTILTRLSQSIKPFAQFGTPSGTAATGVKTVGLKTNWPPSL